MNTCKNCGNNFQGNYCNLCGQSAKTDRINIEFLWEDIEHGLLHYEKGIWYSLKMLFLKPGPAIRDYIEGKRVKHFKPISMVIVLATVYALIYHLGNIKITTSDNESVIKLLENLFHHYYWFIVATLPLSAFTTILMFKKSGFNYSEIVILEAFKSSQRMMIHILSLFFLFYFNSYYAIKIINFTLIFIDIISILWVNIKFFKGFSIIQIILRSLISFILFMIITLIVFTASLLFIGY